MPHKIVNGQQVELTADEIAAIAAQETAWNGLAFTSERTIVESWAAALVIAYSRLITTHSVVSRHSIINI